MGSRVRVPPRSPCSFPSLVFSRLFLLFVKPAHRFDTPCSPFGFRDQCVDPHSSHSLLVGSDSVTLYLVETLVTGNCRDDVGTASGFRETPTGRLAKPVG